MSAACDPVGADEIARRLDVKPETVHQWRYHALLPDPDYTVSGRPAWDWRTIEKWARATGRLEEARA